MPIEGAIHLRVYSIPLTHYDERMRWGSAAEETILKIQEMLRSLNFFTIFEIYSRNGFK